MIVWTNRQSELWHWYRQTWQLPSNWKVAQPGLPTCFFFYYLCWQISSYSHQNSLLSLWFSWKISKSISTKWAPGYLGSLFFFRTRAGCKASTSTSLRVILTSTTEFSSANAKSISLGYQTRLSLHTAMATLATCKELQLKTHPTTHCQHAIHWQLKGGGLFGCFSYLLWSRICWPKGIEQPILNPLSEMAVRATLKAWKSAPKKPLSPIPSWQHVHSNFFSDIDWVNFRYSDGSNLALTHIVPTLSFQGGCIFYMARDVCIPAGGPVLSRGPTLFSLQVVLLHHEVDSAKYLRVLLELT